MKILFLSQSQRLAQFATDPSVRYRCFHLAEELRHFGCLPDICHMEAFEPKFVSRYDVFVFHRPRVDKSFIRVRDAISRSNKMAIADFDDLIFDVNAASASPQVLGRNASLRSVSRQHAKAFQALRSFRHVTVSTTPLQENVRRLMPNAEIAVVPNGLSARWRQYGWERSKGIRPEKIVAYFPGTSSHNHDFPVVEEAMRAFLEQHQEFQFLVVGPLKFKSRLFPEGRVRHLPPVPYYELPSIIARCWFTIAPLADTPFNRCKSGLKFFESAVWGVPVAGTPIADMHRHKEGGAQLPADSAQWIQSLAALARPDFRTRLSEQGRAWSLAFCMAKTSAALWRETIDSWENRK